MKLKIVVIQMLVVGVLDVFCQLSFCLVPVVWPTSPGRVMVTWVTYLVPVA